MKWNVGVALITAGIGVSATCYEPNPSFPVPQWKDKGEVLKSTFDKIKTRLDKLTSTGKFDTSAYAIEVTSGTVTLWENYLTAKKVNASLHGAPAVNGSTYFRIASISKTFTTLAIIKQHDAGKLNLNDAVMHYIEELQGSDSGKLPWKDLSIRTLASQLSGLPREFSQSDLINEVSDPTSIGLPPATKDGLPTCDEYNDYDRSCGRKDLLDRLKKSSPVFAPHQKSTYSNVNFDLLGLVIANVTGKPYEEYIDEAIFQDLNMSSSTFKTPPIERAAIPSTDSTFWDKDLGVSNPTGGIYSTSNDLSKYLRYVLSHYNTIGGFNWLLPVSWSGGVNNFYGMPWEIFRTDKILKHSRRPVTFVSKSGGLPDYFSLIIVVEEYGFGVTLLVAGSAELLQQIINIVTVELVRGAEAAIWEDVDKTYAGRYVAVDDDLDSSFGLKSSPSRGLEIVEFKSNGTQILGEEFYTDMLGGYDTADKYHSQLMPTLLYKDEKTQQGEIWRMVAVSSRDGKAEDDVWDDFCITDIDASSYAGRPVNEVVFWHEKGLVELPAFNLTMKAAKREKESGHESL